MASVKKHGRQFRMLKVFCLLFTLCFCGVFEVARALPQARGELTWYPELMAFEGEMTFEIPQKGRHFELALYPNRYLQNSENRESFEAYTASTRLRERSFLRRKAALKILSAERVVYREKNCQEAFAKVDNSQKSISKTILNFNVTETVATYSAEQAPPSSCHTLRVRFSFSPPHYTGNFGVRTEEEAHYTGPIFPLPLSHLFETQVRFHNTNLFCAGCSRTQNETVLKFSDYPPPIHILERAPRVSEVQVSGQRFLFFDDQTSDATNSFLEIARLQFEELPYLRPRKNRQRPIFVTKDLLLNNLVARQPTEIQLGSAFYKINPLFRVYHEAALLRALLTELMFQSLLEDFPPTNTADLKLLNTMARWFAEKQVRDSFRMIDTVKNVSSSLSFIPFFNDIIRGRALVNNEVYLGREEPENSTDTLPMEALFPTFSGAEAQARVEWCLSEKDRARIDADLDKLIKRQLDTSSFIKKFLATESERCGKSWTDFFYQRSLQEIVELNANSQTPLTSTVHFRRSPDKNRTEGLFESRDKKDVVDVLELQIFEEGNKEKFKTTVSKQTNENKIISAEIAEKNLRASVVGPSTDSNADRHIYPHQLEFLLTGIRLRYDSTQKTLEGSQGIQWRLRGDPYGRAFSLRLVKERNEFSLEPFFGGSVNLQDPNTISSDLQHSDPIPYLPFGIGFEMTLGGSREVWVVGKTGYQRLTPSLLAPEGIEVLLTLGQRVARGWDLEQATRSEVELRLYNPVATLSTIATTLRTGRSTEVFDVGNFVPGFAPNSLNTLQYAATRFEINGVLSHDLKMNILNTAMLEHVVLFGAHNLGLDINKVALTSTNLKYLQSLQGGLRFYGSFLGSKDQLVSIGVSRGLSESPRNEFSFTIGR